MTVLLIVTLIVFGCTALGLWLGTISSHLLLLPADRRRLELLTRQLMAEQQIDNVTRAALQAMRDASKRR